MKSYDAAGNLTPGTDFNGRTTTYQYENLNRLTRKTPDMFFTAPAVLFGYTFTSRRTFMIDSSGNTSYGYSFTFRCGSWCLFGVYFVRAPWRQDRTRKTGET